MYNIPMTLTVEVRENTRNNYLKLWCKTCWDTLEFLDYGLYEVSPGAMELLESMATKHERHNHKHELFIYEGRRLPTNEEIRNG